MNRPASPGRLPVTAGRFPGAAWRERLVRAFLVGLATTAAVACEDDSTTGPDTSRQLTQRIETADITFYFADGDWVNTAYQQAFHEWAVSYLGITLPQRLRYFKYFDNDHMWELTEQPYGSWADVEQYAVHSVEYQQGHEAMHCYSRVIGWPTDFFTEGIAVALDLDPYTVQDIEFFGAPIHTLCRAWLAEGTLYPLRDLLTEDDFWARRWTQTYPQVGSFTRFLIAEFGLELFKQVFRIVDEHDSAETVLNAFQEVYGISLDEAEARWHDFLRSLP